MARALRLRTEKAPFMLGQFWTSDTEHFSFRIADIATTAMASYLRLSGHRQLADLLVAILGPVDLEDHHRLLDGRCEVVRVHRRSGRRLTCAESLAPGHQVAALRLGHLDPLHVLAVDRGCGNQPDVAVLAGADERDEQLKRRWLRTCIWNDRMLQGRSVVQVQVIFEDRSCSCGPDRPKLSLRSMLDLTFTADHVEHSTCSCGSDKTRALSAGLVFLGPYIGSIGSVTLPGSVLVRLRLSLYPVESRRPVDRFRTM